MAQNAVITGWGFYAPSKVVTNFDLEKIVDTSDEWITSRTGIKERRYAAEGETTSSMSLRAGRLALEKARLRPQDLDRVIVVSGTHQNALVIGAETLSRFLNWKDRSTCVLFADGAGAVVIEASNASVGIESAVLHSEGSKGHLLMIEGGGAKHPASQKTMELGQHF